MAKSELGTKRVCPETGRKFYDLSKDPVVSPYTGKHYPLSFFEDTGSEEIEVKAEETTDAASGDTEDKADTSGPEIVSLDDAEDAGADDGSNLPDLGDNTDDEVLDGDQDDDGTFLRNDDDDDDDDVTGIVDIANDDDD